MNSKFIEIPVASSGKILVINLSYVMYYSVGISDDTTVITLENGERIFAKLSLEEFEEKIGKGE